MNFVAVDAAHNGNFPITESVGNRYIIKIQKHCFLFVRLVVRASKKINFFSLLSTCSIEVVDVKLRINHRARERDTDNGQQQ